METLHIPGEKEIKQWVRESMLECLGEIESIQNGKLSGKEPLDSRDSIADYLNISLVTLTDWMKKGLPYHKPNGRVYFIRSEVIEYITLKRLKK